MWGYLGEEIVSTKLGNSADLSGLQGGGETGGETHLALAALEVVRDSSAELAGALGREEVEGDVGGIGAVGDQPVSLHAKGHTRQR